MRAILKKPARTRSKRRNRRPRLIRHGYFQNQQSKPSPRKKRDISAGPFQRWSGLRGMIHDIELTKTCAFWSAGCDITSRLSAKDRIDNLLDTQHSWKWMPI